MSFYPKNDDGSIRRLRVALDCQKAIEDGDEDIMVEQHHKAECDINQIIKKHAGNIQAIVGNFQAAEMRFDDVTGNDFQEAMNKVNRARDEFLKLPVKVRRKFNNSPAEFLDFVQNPANVDEMISLGLAVKPKPVEPMKVLVVNPETPPE